MIWCCRSRIWLAVSKREPVCSSAWVKTLFDEPVVPIVAATDSVLALPRMISSWVPGRFVALGTDGFGLSERREVLRTHFQVDSASIIDPARKLAGS